MRHQKWDKTPRTRRTPAKRRRDQRVTRYRQDALELTIKEDAAQGSVRELARSRSREEGALAAPAAASSAVQPVMVVRKNAAYRGVYWRIVGAALSGLVTAIALATLMFSPMPTFVFMVAVVIAGASALVTITLAMSARKEEEVHQLAASLQRQDVALLEPPLREDAPLPGAPASLKASRAATDGELERRWTADP